MSKNDKIPPLEVLISLDTDSYNCNLKEKAMAKCFYELDQKRFFKKRKFKQCLRLEKEFQHCLVYSNQMSLNKRDNYKSEVNNIEIYNKYKDIRSDNKKDAFDFVQGKKTEDDIINKSNANTTRKKIIEL